MRLRIATPGAVVVELDGVVAVRAEDETGEFGIRTGHADFVTALAVSVVGWRTGDGAAGYCAVRGGLLTVRGGMEVAVASREAAPGRTLAELENDVRARLAAEAEAERQARIHSEQLRARAIREMVGVLRPRGADGLGGGA